MSGKQTVYKTLLIGLGSTGTRIVERLMNKVNWELGDVDRAPWIEYLAIETDETEFAKNPLLSSRPQDTYHLGLSETDFSQIRETVRRGESSSINVSSWADLETLNMLSDSSVKSGAGNIRMIGRLAFLHRQNFESIKSRVLRRLDRLRALSPLVATEKRGVGPDGTSTDVEFATEGIHIFVVGALAGGTASGCASDVGFFVHSLKRDIDRSIGIFTVPRPSLTSAVNKNAERLKKNAYQALLELNHYHLPGREGEPPIQFADGSTANMDAFPYDLTYILMPKGDASNAEEAANQAAADRLFLNIFAPGANTANRAVDATPFGSGTEKPEDFSDRDHRAHVFCSFGLAVVDFPVQRVVEACQKRLISRSLQAKVDLNRDELTAESLLLEMGLTWDLLVRDLLEDTPELDSFLNNEIASIREIAVTGESKARDRLEKLNRAFRNVSEPTDALEEPGGVTQYLRTRRKQVVARAMTRVKNVIQDSITDPEIGVRTIIHALNLAKKFVEDLDAQARGGSERSSSDLNEQFDRLSAYNRHPLLSFLGLRGVVLEHHKASLDTELRKFVDGLRLRSATYALAAGGEYMGDVGAISILADLKRHLRSAIDRTDNLYSRLSVLRNQSSIDEINITRAPVDNGVTLFKSFDGVEATVDQEYAERLRQMGYDEGLTIQQVEKVRQREVLERLTGVADVIALEQGKTWLDARYSPGSSEMLIPLEMNRHIEDAALQPFRDIASTEVISLLNEMPEVERRDRISQAAKAASPFLEVNAELATKGGRSSVASTAFAIMPESVASDDLWQLVQNEMPSDVRRENGNEPHRIVMIHEQYRFPLSGVPDIVGLSDNRPSLSAAESNDFPLFASRIDVPWTPITEREIRRIRIAEETLATALVAGAAEIISGHVVIPGEQQFGVGDERFLTGDFRGAVRMLAESPTDEKGLPLGDAASSNLAAATVSLLRQRYQGGIGSTQRSAYENGNSQQSSGQTFERFLVESLDKTLREGFRTALHGAPNEQEFRRLVNRFLAREPDLYKELSKLNPLSDAHRERLFRKEGARKSDGSIATKDGFYCPVDGTLIGETEQEAELNGWRCYAYPALHNRETEWGQGQLR